MTIQTRRLTVVGCLMALVLGLGTLSAAAQSDPLPSWNEGPAKQAIKTFVARTTTPGHFDFVPVEERIAVFDNDGTLWAEQPVYFQLAFAFDRITVLAAEHPEWQTKQPYKAVLDHDINALAALGEKGLLEIIAVTHSGMSTERFSKVVSDWIVTAPPALQPAVHQPRLPADAGTVDVPSRK
jgi:haloacid dehalogenase-like hydrolase